MKKTTLVEMIKEPGMLFEVTQSQEQGNRTFFATVEEVEYMNSSLGNMSAGLEIADSVIYRKAYNSFVQVKRIQ